MHRNGRTKEDEEIAIDEEVVNAVIHRIKIFVADLDRKLKDKEQVEEINTFPIDIGDIEDF